MDRGAVEAWEGTGLTHAEGRRVEPAANFDELVELMCPCGWVKGHAISVCPLRSEHAQQVTDDDGRTRFCYLNHVEAPFLDAPL